MTNLEQLVEAGLIPAEYESSLSSQQLDAIESLTCEEVTHMISGAQKLGQEFFEEHVPHGAYF